MRLYRPEVQNEMKKVSIDVLEVVFQVYVHSA